MVLTNTYRLMHRTPVQDLDALRAFAMFLGIVRHTGSFLYPDPSNFWPVHNARHTADAGSPIGK